MAVRRMYSLPALKGFLRSSWCLFSSTCKKVTACIASILCISSAPALAEDPLEGFRPLGRLVSVGEHKLHIHCTGKGSPTVLLEAGIGGNHLDWILAQPIIAQQTRVCSYDRAGYGWSERGPKPRLASSISAELQMLVRRAGLEGPFVLVGHSFGGLLSIYFAAKYADEVVGLVLVDSMHHDQYDVFAEEGIKVASEPSRAVIYSGRDLLTYGIPPAYQDMAYELATTDKTRSFMFNELRNMKGTMSEVRPVNLRGLPVRLIIHGRREWDKIYKDGRMERVWRTLQADLQKTHRGAPLILAADAGHQIPLDAPKLVAQVVSDVVAVARRSRPEAYGNE